MPKSKNSKTTEIDPLALRFARVARGTKPNEKTLAFLKDSYRQLVSLGERYREARGES